MSSKRHWEKVYGTKRFNEMSWYQASPQPSIDFIHDLKIPKHAAIIDVGGGDSYFAEELLAEGYSDITVVDISEAATQRAKERLGLNSEKINWIISDIATLPTNKKFDYWHDRATFHFFTDKAEIKKYLTVVENHLADGGKMMLATFSTAGPEKCSGLPVRQYNETGITRLLKKGFEKIKCITIDHLTPFNTVQNFLFCCFNKLKSENGYS